MGIETAALIGLGLSAAGAGATAVEQHRVANRQEDIATNRLRTQQRKQQEANAILESTLGKIKGSDGEAERQQANADFVDQLRANAAQATGGETVGGSARFRGDSQSTDAAIKNYGMTRAGQMAKLVAPGRQRANEARLMRRADADVSGVARDANAEDAILMQRALSTGANPWVMAAGQFAQGAGNALGSMGGRVTDSDLLTSQAMSNGRVASVLDGLKGRNLFGGP